MTRLAEALAEVGDALMRLVAVASDGGTRMAGDDDLLSALAEAGRLRRLSDSLIVEAVGQLLERDDARPHPDRITTTRGCRSLAELIQRATRVSGRTAADAIAGAKAVQKRRSLATGEELPAELPRLREAMLAGDVGIEGVLAVVGAFRGCAVGRTELLAADEELAAASRGSGADGAPPASVDDLRALASVWAAYFDQDGAEPREARAMRRRGFTIGRGRDGLVPVRGDLLPEVAAQLRRGLDSILNPRVDGAAAGGPRFCDDDEPRETAAEQRTFVQKQHDALAVLLAAAASSGELPLLGGAAPTLVVSVREEDLARGRGVAHVNGDEPVSLAAARHIACSGAVQRVVTRANGRIVSIGTLDRVFNRHQRRAIALRDGGCVIPGCRVSAEWCEIHHVDEYARGGPTHTDNGVLLCWFHHRTIDTGGWRIRMNDGAPEVRGPAWWDPVQRWRPATNSPTRLRDRMALRV